MSKLFFPDLAHWYWSYGAPCHSVLAAGTGLQRPTTLRDARKLALFPSVTNILGVIAKPELIAWLQEQAVMAALTLPRIAGEPEDAFARRVVADSLTTRDGAADFGTAFHHGAERVAQTGEVDPNDPLAPWLNLFRDWFKANVVICHWTERTLIHPALGYGGTADMLVEIKGKGLCLLDLKTQNVKSSGPSTYKSWGYQLAAYRKALLLSADFCAFGRQPVTCMNLIMNSREAHPPVEAPWSETEMERCWTAFEAARQLWIVEKNFDPCASRTGASSPAAAAGGKNEIVLTA